MSRIKIGILGAGRGMDMSKNFLLLNCDIVAVCDDREDRRERITKELGDSVAVYDNFDDFIQHDMDAVILANFFHEHAPYAIKCFEKGIHVFSECISNGTMAEGVEMIRAFEKSNSVYMLAENYPQMKFAREIHRVSRDGSLGKILYAEGEYNHPGNPDDTTFKKLYNYFPEHWRNFVPRSYYITHSLGPIMWATGATPKRVTSFSTFAPIKDDSPSASYGGDRAAIVTTQNDDGSIFRVTGCAAFGGHHITYRVCGTEGQVENLRGMGDKIMLRYNDWNIPEGMQEINLYEPEWNDRDIALIETSGHGGSDYLTARYFLECIKEKHQPEHPFDIYSAVAMSSVAILAHRSMLEGGKPYDIPDFRIEEDCVKYENDYLSPFPKEDGKRDIPCCSVPDYKPTEENIKNYKKSLKME